MTLVLLTASAALAEDTDFTFVPSEANMAHGEYQTIRVDAVSAFSVFVFDNWKPAAENTQGKNVIAEWTTDDGRFMLLGTLDSTQGDLNNLEDVGNMLEGRGNIVSYFNMNGMDVCISCTEDMLTRYVVVELPTDIYILGVYGMTDESQIDEADTMLYSLVHQEYEIQEIGVKSEELDMEAGHLIPININNGAITMYVNNAYQTLPQEDSWEAYHKIGSGENENGQHLDFYAAPLSELGVANLNGMYSYLTKGGYGVMAATVNGVPALYFYANDAKVERGIGMMVDDYVFMVIASGFTNEAQESELLQMLLSISPAY